METVNKKVEAAILKMKRNAPGILEYIGEDQMREFLTLIDAPEIEKLPLVEKKLLFRQVLAGIEKKGCTHGK